jgi:hypothetical protein
VLWVTLMLLILLLALRVLVRGKRAQVRQVRLPVPLPQAHKLPMLEPLLQILQAAQVQQLPVLPQLRPRPVMHQDQQVRLLLKPPVQASLR